MYDSLQKLLMSVSHTLPLKILKDHLEIPRKDDVEQSAIEAVIR